MNLCIFSRTFYPAIGGLERMAQILATNMVKLGHTVEVVTDTCGLSNKDDLLFPYKITRTHRYQVRTEAFLRADAVLFMNVSLHGMLPAALSRATIVLSHHGVYYGRGPLGILFASIKRQLTLFFTNISVSRFVACNIPAESVVIHNAYDADLFVQPDLTTRQRDFVFCGRLVSDKGTDLCVRAFAKVLESVPDATLTLIGDGLEHQPLQILTRDLGVANQVTFTGALRGERLVTELQRHACLIAPSLVEEGFGLTAVEGIACCDTVIVSRRGGLPEAVGDCGLVVEPSVEELSVAMTSVITARRAGRALPGQSGEAARKAHLAQHTPEAVTQKYLRVIEQAIVGKQRRGSR